MQQPSLQQYTFWNQKAQFQLSCDQYSDWVMFVVEQGKFRYRIHDAENTAGSGEIVICPPHTDFHREILSDTLTFHFIRFDWPNIKAELLIFLDRGNQTAFKPQESERMLSTCRHLRLAFDRDKPVPAYIADHYLFDLLLLLRAESERAEQGRSTVADALMDDARSMITDRAFKPMHIQDVATALNISKVQLTRRFHAAFRMKPIDYLTQVRMARVKLLLTETNYTIDHIAGLCGYDNGFYLSRVFSRRIGHTPSQYREKHRL